MHHDGSGVEVKERNNIRKVKFIKLRKSDGKKV